MKMNWISLNHFELNKKLTTKSEKKRFILWYIKLLHFFVHSNEIIDSMIAHLCLNHNNTHHISDGRAWTYERTRPAIISACKWSYRIEATLQLYHENAQYSYTNWLNWKRDQQHENRFVLEQNQIDDSKSNKEQRVCASIMIRKIFYTRDSTI